jgi:hypothetical protein
MTSPPRVAEWLLAHALATSERDAVIGDLCEEYACIVPMRGLMRARYWYRWQVARSLTPLLVRSWERASVRRASTAAIGAAFVATVPGSALIMIRSFVLQQVPLKTTADLSFGFGVALAFVLLASGGISLATAFRVLNTDSRQR